MNRRDLLRLAGAGAFTLAAHSIHGRLEGTARAATSRRPRFFLHIIASGGIDAVYGADPKTTREVDKGIDVPYPAKDIVTTKSAALGPAFAALRPWMPRLAIVNAFQQNSANHQSGLVHVTCCRSTAVTGTPTLLDVLGTRRNGPAVGAITIGTAFAAAFSPKFLGEPTSEQFGLKPGLLDHLDAAAPHQLVEAAGALRREAKAAARTSSQEAVTVTNLLESAALLDSWAASPRFAPKTWRLEHEDEFGGGRDLERALWLFEHGVARCVTVAVGAQSFDTHAWNNVDQPWMSSYLAGLLARLFQELDSRTVDGVSLADQTIVFVGSEIGRFPRLNAVHGKDHFPQVSYLFFGPWFATGRAYGGTDRGMIAHPISLATGTPDASGHVLTVDDIGTTLLHLDGANPEVYGYAGSHMRFLAGA